MFPQFNPVGFYILDRANKCPYIQKTTVLEMKVGLGVISVICDVIHDVHLSSQDKKNVLFASWNFYNYFHLPVNRHESNED